MPIHGLGFIGREYRHLKRYRQITLVLLKYGLGDLVDTIGLRRRLGLTKRAESAGKGVPSRLSRWERLRMALEELGPSFVKLGQIASTRPDMLPHDLCLELEKLQDTVKPFGIEQVRQVFQKELGKPIGDAFRDFQDTPIASASMAQVHRAVLPSGEVVAVKIQRPEIETIIKVDLEIMLDLAKLAERHLRDIEAINPVGLVKEFAKTIRKELDFTIEASHIERFGRNFKGDPTIHVPKVYRELSTPKVLTMEFIDGIKVSELDTLREKGYDLALIANRGADLLLKQIFEHGFFHADPHPGNILILPDHIICFLDYGMMGNIAHRFREPLDNLVVGIVRRDSKRITKALLGLSLNGAPLSSEIIESDIADFVEQHFYRPLKEINMGELIKQLIQLLARHKLKITPDFYLLTKALATVESNGVKLSPDFDMISHTEPFVRKILARQINPVRIMKNFYQAGVDGSELIRSLPGDIKEILNIFKRGRTHIEFEHRGLEPMLERHERISNRIVFGMVLSALIIGSSLIVLSDVPPKWNGVPVIGIGGFVAAAIMGFGLLISIIRHGKM